MQINSLLQLTEEVRTSDSQRDCYKIFSKKNAEQDSWLGREFLAPKRTLHSNPPYHPLEHLIHHEHATAR
jgi:hypothetical protein